MAVACSVVWSVRALCLFYIVLLVCYYFLCFFFVTSVYVLLFYVFRYACRCTYCRFPIDSVCMSSFLTHTRRYTCLYQQLFVLIVLRIDVSLRSLLHCHCLCYWPSHCHGYKNKKITFLLHTKSHQDNLGSKPNSPDHSSRDNAIKLCEQQTYIISICVCWTHNG